MLINYVEQIFGFEYMEQLIGICDYITLQRNISWVLYQQLAECF